MRILKIFNKLDNEGATAIEYALIASLISVAAIAGMKLVSGAIRSKMEVISTELANAGNGN